MSTAQLAKTQEGFLGMLQDPRMISEVQKVCPSFLDPIKLFRIATNQFKSTPKLQRCDPTSLMSCLMDSAVCGLMPDGKYAHMVPYGSTATFVPDWKGLVMLGMKSPELKRWRTDVVCDGDTFSHDRGRILHHTWDIAKPRGDILGFYSEVVYANGEEDFEFCTLSEAKAIQKRSASGGSGPWATDFSEMGRKTSLRRHSKRLGHLLTKEFEEALERDYDNLPSATDVTAEVSQKATEHLKRLKDTAPRPTSASEGPNKVEEVVVDPVPPIEEDDIPMVDASPDKTALHIAITVVLDRIKSPTARLAKLRMACAKCEDIEDVSKVTSLNWKELPDHVLEQLALHLSDRGN